MSYSPPDRCTILDAEPKKFALEARRLLTIADRKWIEKRELSNSEPVRRFFAASLGIRGGLSRGGNQAQHSTGIQSRGKLKIARLEIAAAKRER
jgi:hypothetical protein